MVVNNFQDIFESVPRTSVLTLPTLKELALKIEYDCKDDGINSVCSSPELPLPFASTEIFYANISEWRRLTAAGIACKTVYEVTFDFVGSSFKFKAGDTIGVIPRNDDSDVELVIAHLDLKPHANVPYTLSVDSSKKANIPAHVPAKSTLRYCLTHCVDLRTVLKKLFLLALAKYTKDEEERNILDYFCSKEGSAAYITHILNKNLCLLDIFNIFKSCKPPIEVLLANLPRLLPRPYSIVNSGLKNNDKIVICFSVMTINNRKGLTTGWLEEMILNKEMGLENQMKKLSFSESKTVQKVPIYLRKNLNQFCVPVNSETPLILIGPGTGVAPFIGFMEERAFLKSECPNLKLGNTWLFFGCRDPKLDFIYENEMNGFLKEGTLHRLSTAFSRIENSQAKYIQDSLKQNGTEVAQLIKDGATVFVCGDKKTLATQVKEVIMKCLCDHCNMNAEEAEKFINIMQKDKKIVIDTWS